MHYKNVFLALCLLTVAGCAGTAGMSGGIDPHNPQSIAASVKLAHDPHENSTNVDGPLVFADGFVLNDGYSAFIHKKADGSVKAGILFAVRFDHWAYLDAAYSEGRKYPLQKISQDVESCNTRKCHLTEAVGLNLSLEQIRQLAKKPVFSVKLTGRTGEKVFSIPGTYFQGLLAKYDETQKQE